MRYVRLASLLIALSTALWSQSFRGSIAGTVVDASGAMIPAAGVQAVNKGTNITFDTTSTEAGEFLLPNLPLGEYTVTIKKDGFQTQKIDNVEVAVSKTTNITAKLGIASQGTIVEISATAATLETTSSSLASVVTPRQVQDMPMNGRDFRQMLKLNPGVSPTSGSVNGNRGSGNNYQIDGADNNDAFHNGTAVNQGGVSGIAGTLLPIEAIDQFAIVSNASAEMGRNGGSNVNMVIKSGTNDFHGTAYYFNRNEALAALSPFRTNDTKRVMRNNQWGFSAGGPIVKNKLFFFTTLEAQKAIAGLNFLTTHPSTAWANQARQVLTQYNVPVSTVATNLLSFWPSRYNNLGATNNNLAANDRADYDSYNGIGKLDYAISSKHQISGRYFGGTGKQAADAGVPYREYFQVAPSRMHNIAIVQTSTLSPRLVSQLLLGVNYFKQTFNDLDLSPNPIAAGLNTGVPQDGTLGGSPTLRITGFAGASATQPLGRIDTSGHITENLSYTIGRHSFKFGGEYRRANFDVFYDTNKRGSFTFDGARGPWATDTSLSPQLRAMADFMAGYISATNGATIVRGQLQRDYRQNTYDWWIHDNFQVNRKLNLNFGVRYSYVGPLFAAKNEPITSFSIANGFQLAGKGGIDLWPKDMNNFAPRFGFAYNVASKTVIRGSYGFFYDVPPLNFMVANTGMPNGGSAGIHANPAGPDPVFTITRSSVNIEPGVAIFPSTATAPTNVGAYGVSRDFRIPYIQNYNFNVQHQLSGSTVIQAGYVGSKGTKLSLLRSINPIVGAVPNAAGTGMTGGARMYASQYPTLGAINILETIANSNYNSLQTSVRTTRVKGFTLNANYTLGKSLDNGSNVRNALAANSFNLRREYGPSNFDMRQIFTAFALYDVPQLGNFAPRLTKGWQLNALFTAHSGEPLDLTSGTNRSGSGDNRDRVDVIGQWNQNVPVQTVPNGAVPYFNKSAFAAAALGTYGNIGRDSFYGPGFNAVDFSVFKETPITERIRTQFRVEIFNLFNRTNYANPTTAFNSANFGLITATRNGGSAPGIGFGEPRNVQLALKLIW